MDHDHAISASTQHTSVVKAGALLWWVEVMLPEWLSLKGRPIPGWTRKARGCTGISWTATVSCSATECSSLRPGKPMRRLRSGDRRGWAGGRAFTRANLTRRTLDRLRRQSAHRVVRLSCLTEGHRTRAIGRGGEVGADVVVQSEAVTHFGCGDVAVEGWSEADPSA